MYTLDLNEERACVPQFKHALAEWMWVCVSACVHQRVCVLSCVFVFKRAKHRETCVVKGTDPQSSFVGTL